MKRKLTFRLLIGSMIVMGLMAFSGLGTMSLDGSEGQYVLVTLKDKSTLKFEYDSFEFNWIVPSIKNEITCNSTDFHISEVEEIYVLNQTWNPCSKKDDWLFDVSLKDKKPVQGFFELSGESVLGKLFDSGEQREIPFTNISKVSFH